jgi:hypothetical protein
MMSTKPVAVAAVVAMAVAAPFALGQSGGGGASARRAKVIRGSGPAPGSLRTDVDVGTPGDSPGDISVFRNIETTSSGRRLGVSVGRCVIVRTGPDEDWLADCAITHQYKGGSIMVAGAVKPRSDRPSVQAVTGGTGRFTGAFGTETTTPLGNRRFGFTIRYRLR